MSKNLNTKDKTKKRKRTEGDIIKRPRLPNPNEPSKTKENIVDVYLNNPVKREEVVYPDTRFECSTTLFPAKEVQEECLASKASNDAFKRCAEEELISTMSKTIRASNLDATINPVIPDDCMIIENLQKQVKIEIIDLTDDPGSVVSELSCPVKIGYQKRTANKPSTILQPNGDLPIKVELSDKTYEINDNVIGAEDMNYSAIQRKSKYNIAEDSNSETSKRNYSLNINKNTSSVEGILSHQQLKIGNSLPNGCINKANKDHSVNKSHLGNHFQIKAEKYNLRENNTESNSEKYEVTVSKDTNCKTSSINLRSDPNKENEYNREINNQVQASVISVCNSKESADYTTSVHQLNDFPIKIEQNENRIVNDKSISLAKFFSDIKRASISSVCRPIKSEQSRNNGNCEIRSNYTSVSHSTSVSCSELETEHRSMFINEQQTYEKVDNELSKCSVNCKEMQEDVVWDKSKKNRDSSCNYLTADHLRKKPEKDIQENSYSYQKTQSYEDVSQKNTETIICNEFKQISNSPIANSAVFSDDSQSYDPSTFPMPLLRYWNCNMKVDIVEISHALSILNSIKDKEENTFDCHVINLEEIPHSTDSQDNREFNLTEKREEQPNRVNFSDSHTNFNSPVSDGNLLEENCQSTISLSSLDDNNWSENLNNLAMEAKIKPNKNVLSNDCLRQILSNVKSRKKSDISYISPSMKASDQEVKSNVNEEVFQNLQIKMTGNKTVESMISPLNVNEKNSEHTEKNSENFSKLLRGTNESYVKQGVLYNQFVTYDETFEAPPKKVKKSEDALISKSGNPKKSSNRKYKKGTCMNANSHHVPDHLIGKHLVTDFLLNSPDSSSSNFEQNRFTSPGNIQNESLPIFHDTSSHNPGYHPSINPNCLQDPELPPNCSPTVHENVNFQKQLNSLNISQFYSSCSTPATTESFIHPHLEQIPSISLTNVTKNSSCVPSTTESFFPPIVATKIQQLNQMISEINSFCPSNFLQRNSEKNSAVLSSDSESISSFMTQYNLHRSVQDVKGLLSLPHFQNNALSPSQSHHLLSQEIPPIISRHSAITDDYCSSESVHHEFIDNPPLPANSPPPLPPLPSASPNVELFNSFPSNCSQSSLINNHKKNTTVKSNSSKFIFNSLLPKQLKKDIGKNIIHTNDVYLIIIETNIDLIHSIDKEIRGKLLEVRDSYANHLMYYNTYFPLLLLECFSKISTILKGLKREKINKRIYKIAHFETKQNYVSFKCDGFIRHSDVENIPKDGHIILIKFGTVPAGGVRMLGFVCSSATRAYSHKHDHTHEILKHLNVNKRTELIKIKINFYIVFPISGINLDLPIEISKLASIKKTLILNDALKELLRSPLCNTILNPRNNNCKNFTLPPRLDTNTMVNVVQRIVQSLKSSSSQLIVIESAPFTDSFLAIVQIVEKIKKRKIPGKILVCVRLEMLNDMGMNLAETSSKVIIINRERENVREKLHNKVLDVLASQLANSQNISYDVAKSKVLQEADVILVVTRTCFYEDVQCMARNLAFCIIHDAHSFTEPECLLPLLYGIRHLLLFGSHEELCHASSKRASSLGYNKSLFHRAYNSC